MKTRNEVKTNTVVTPFQIKLPSELDLKPKWTVPVSKNYTARIYEQTVDETNGVTGDKVGTKIQFVMTVRHNVSGNSPGTIHNNFYNAHRGSGTMVFGKILDVTMALERMAELLQPKKKTTTVVDESDDD